MLPNLIYDIGMNNGDDTAYYLKRGFDVLAVEANPKLAATAAERFVEEIKSGRLTILNIGIAEEEGEFPFWICETRSEWSSFNKGIASRDGCPHHEIRVPCRRFRTVWEEFGIPYYLKIDIEGNDMLCVQELDPMNLPKFISMECIRAYAQKSLALLHELGFKGFKCISQQLFLPLELPPAIEQRRYERAHWLVLTKNPLVRAFRFLGGRSWIHQELNRSRTYDSWTFPSGSSGPFGDDLPGRWLNYDEMKATYEYYCSLFDSKKHSVSWDLWCDFHARCH
jgi:FkbM family methyltransferase